MILPILGLRCTIKNKNTIDIYGIIGIYPTIYYFLFNMASKQRDAIATIILTFGLIVALSLLAVGIIVVSSANNGVVTLQGLAMGFTGFVILVALAHKGSTPIE